MHHNRRSLKGIFSPRFTALGKGPSRAFKRALAALSLLACLLSSACRTPGETHLYTLSGSNHTGLRVPDVSDLDPVSGATLATVPTHTSAGEKIVGLAYDPFTDHLFLRLSPGNSVRVIDRPAGAVKREFLAPRLPLGGDDLAISGRNRHLFFTDSTGPALFETFPSGALRRRILLEGLDAPVRGVACDARGGGFLILPVEVGDRVRRFDSEGRAKGEITLAQSVRGRSLAFDSVQRKIFAVLADSPRIGVFSETGNLLRTLPAPDGDEVLLDLGPRSLIRLF